ncbi:MAG: type I-E CRISPR-associated protein Cas6/Cse3/CasE [Sutterellaceae bacterium]|nr:type I-E CRISPR-associated protein Cas6/Cse3/CasE [Burkholderiaceae bacterium]MDW8430082.1 type I-E CRISPR-associated protein Cas6/Cse3/CasE [Sutterellaceae bacterium]
MKYFSRIELDENHPDVQEAVAQSFARDAYGDHQFLWQFFPAPKGHPRDFLFRRFEPQGDRRQALFYCVSSRPAVSPHPAWKVATREYAPRVERGDRLLFDLRVNPTQAHKREGKSRRDDVVMHAKKRLLAEHGLARWGDLPPGERPSLYELSDQAVRKWLGEAGRDGICARHGFSVMDDLRVDAYRQHRIARTGQKPILLSTVDLSGTITVIDPERFTRALLFGIGRGKAFGCGLLLVRRARGAAYSRSGQ